MAIRLILISITIALVSTVFEAAAGEKDKFVGTWSLYTYEIRNKAGKWVTAATRLGSNPLGYIIYDATGNMAVQIMRRDRSPIGSKDWNKVLLENFKDAYLGYSAYFGTYEINEQKGVVTHHRIGHMVPDRVGTSVKRFYTIENDTLILMPRSDLRLSWKKLK